MYDSGTRIDTFTETKDFKTVKLNSASSMVGAQIIDVFQTDNLWQTFLYSILYYLFRITNMGLDNSL